MYTITAWLRMSILKYMLVLLAHKKAGLAAFNVKPRAASNMQKAGRSQIERRYIPPPGLEPGSLG